MASENLVKEIRESAKDFVKTYGWHTTIVSAIAAWAAYFTVKNPESFERLLASVMADPVSKWVYFGCLVLTVLAWWDKRRYDRMQEAFCVTLDRCTDKCNHLEALAISILNERDEEIVTREAFERHLHLLLLAGVADEASDLRARTQIRDWRDEALEDFAPRLTLSPILGAHGRRKMDKAPPPPLIETD